jgi:hypothetical protein
VLSLRYTTGPASPSRTGQDSFGYSIFMIVADNPRYKRFSYQDHDRHLLNKASQRAWTLPATVAATVAVAASVAAATPAAAPGAIASSPAAAAVAPSG